MPHVAFFSGDTLHAKSLLLSELHRTTKDAITKTSSLLILLSLSLSLSLRFSFLPAHFCNKSHIESQVSWTDLPSSCTGLSVHRHLAEIFAICLGTTESVKKSSGDHSTHYPLNKQILTKLQSERLATHGSNGKEPSTTGLFGDLIGCLKHVR